MAVRQRGRFWTPTRTLKSRVDRALAWLVEDGATSSDALVTLLVELEAEGPAILVIDMVEQGLDQLRLRRP